jgi:hypothetical protein
VIAVSQIIKMPSKRSNPVDDTISRTKKRKELVVSLDVVAVVDPQ